MWLCKTWSRQFGAVGRLPIPVDSRVSLSLCKLPKPMIRPYLKKIPPLYELKVKGPLGEMTLPLHNGFSIREVPLTYPSSVTSNTSSSIILPDRNWFVDLDMDNYAAQHKFEKEFTEAMWGTTATHIRNAVQGITEVLFTR